MNYKFIYDQLIDKRRSSPVAGELHHILPKSWGGSDDSSNLVKLTIREHYIAHKLLVKLSNNNDEKRKMLYALQRMTPYTQKTSRAYQVLKQNFSKFQKEHMNEIVGSNGETRRQVTTRKSAQTRKTTLVGDLSIEDLRIRKISKGSTETIEWEHLDGRKFTGTAIELSRAFLGEKIGPSRLLENLNTPEYHRGWRSISGGQLFSDREKTYTTVRTWTKKSGENFTGTAAELARHDSLYPSRLERFAKLNRRCDGWKASFDTSSR